MKTKSALLVLGSFAILFSCQKADPGKEIGALQLSKQFPQPGDSITLAYATGEMEEESEIEAFYHYFVGTKAYGEDLEFIHFAGVLKAGMAIPDSATAVIFNFSKNGKVYNNDNKGYFLPLYNNSGERLPGSRANEAYFYNYLNDEYGVQDVSALALIEKDLQQNPDLEQDWENIYSRMLYLKDKEKLAAYQKKRIAFYSGKKNLTDDDYYNLTVLYSRRENKKVVDSLLEIGRDKHPTGRVAKWYYSEKFAKEKDSDRREEIFNEFQDKMNGSNAQNMIYEAQTLAAKFAAEKNWEKFDHYSALISDIRWRANSYNNVARSIAEKGEDLEKAEELSERALESFAKYERDLFFTAKQHEKNQKTSKPKFLDTYSLILFKRGKLTQAIVNQEKAAAEGTNGEYNERYLQYLLANKDFEKAEKKGAEYISTFTATPKAREYYREAFGHVKGSAKGLDQRFIELDQLGYEKALIDTRKKMLNEEAPAFELADLDGNPVSLESLSRKTVILDFWATWCRPCIAAFPGMQMAVNRFENDDSVQFLFINTFEHGPELNSEVSEFLEKNNYSFLVLIDEQKEDANQYKTASAYGVRGIPTKVIIGPDGKLRFKYYDVDSSNNDQMVKELEIMVELAKFSGEAPAK